MKCDRCQQPATWRLKENGEYENEEYRCEQCFREIFVSAGWKRIKPSEVASRT
jgi:hypothetical protein